MDRRTFLASAPAAGLLFADARRARAAPLAPSVRLEPFDYKGVNLGWCGRNSDTVFGQWL